MTPAARRKIAEEVNAPHPTGAHSDYRYNISNTDVIALVNDVVEERQKYLHMGCAGNTGSEGAWCTHWEDNHHLQALRELGLDGVNWRNNG